MQFSITETTIEKLKETEIRRIQLRVPVAVMKTERKLPRLLIRLHRNSGQANDVAFYQMNCEATVYSEIIVVIIID